MIYYKSLIVLVKNGNISCRILSLGVFSGKEIFKRHCNASFYARIPFSLEYIRSKGKDEQDIILH